ncbi:GNAT family N-acetyltransferase [Wukongibacter baidiensis]|uniref:GNAT family N-acetyltransferase n=1 Tax=Wukongibacter baidiensis TaxID=1723361 RepID=UPI003D7FA4FD
MFDKTIRIDTERLTMRPFTLDDRDSIFNIMKDKEMYLYTPDEPWSGVESAEEFIKMVLWLYDMNHHNFRHFFAMTIKQSGEIIGFCGIGGIAYDRSKNEVFYSIGKDHWGKGYATEAAKAMLKYAFEELELDNIIAAVHPENIASNRVLQKIGLKKVGVISGLPEEHAFFNDEYLYSLDKEEIV